MRNVFWLILLLGIPLGNISAQEQSPQTEEASAQEADKPEENKTEAGASKAQPTVKPEPYEGANPEELLAKQLDSGEVKWLNDKQGKFLGIFEPSQEASTKGSLMLLPEHGSMANAEGIIETLLTDSDRRGWHVLSISPPGMDIHPIPMDNLSLSQEAKSEQETQNLELLLSRLLAAEAELLKGGGRYVLVAQGIMAEMCLELVISKMIKPVMLVTLDIEHPHHARNKKINQLMRQLRLPLLDVVSEQTGIARERQQQMSGRVSYRQVFYPAKNQDFIGQEQVVAKRIHDWLKKQLESM